MKNTLLTLSLSAMLLGAIGAPARAVVLMDEDINISFSFSNNFNGNPAGKLPANPDRKTIDSTAMAFHGTHALEEIHPEALNTWGGQELSFESQLGGETPAAERSLTQFDDKGKVRLTWWYKVLDPVDLNNDTNPENDTNPANVLPVSSISLRYNDPDNYKLDDAGNVEMDDMGNPVLAPANEDLTLWDKDNTGRTYNMIADGAWHQGSVIVDLLSAPDRAALDQNGNDDHDTAAILKFSTDISKVQTQHAAPPFPADFEGAPSHYFIDLVEMHAIPEPATLGLLGMGCLMTALGRRRRA